MPGIDDWLAVARSADPDELRERILTGYRGGKPFTPYVPTIELPSPCDWVLDFGCGVGRSFPYLKSIAAHVAGFDLSPMIERCRALATEPVDLLGDDWDFMKRRRFDVIFATLVLQHIEPDRCRSYVADFASMTPTVYLLTRSDSDFGTSVLDLIAETGVFDAGACTKVDHDPGTHQLRVLGRVSFDAARTSSESAHYELLLQSRLFGVRS